MPKPKQPYISFFEFLLDEEQGFLREQGMGEYYYETIEYDPATQFLGALQPFRDLRKDFKETFTPYSSFKSVLFEFLQPLIGILNIGKMFFNAIGVPFTFLICTLYFCFEPTTFLANMRINFIRSGSWLVDGFASGIRGLIQLITTPLTFSLRMPLRGVKSIQKKKQPRKKIYPRIESLVHAKEQVKMFETTLVPYLDVTSFKRLTATCHIFKSLKIELKEFAYKPLVSTWTDKKPQLYSDESYEDYCKSVLALRGIIEAALKSPTTPIETFNQLFSEVLTRGCEKLQPLLIDKINVRVSLRSYKQVTVLTTFFHLAARQGDAKIMKTLSDKGAPVDTAGPGFIPTYDDTGGMWLAHHGHTPLDVAAMNGHVDCMRLLIEKKADINHQSSAYGDTPLHHAARRGHLECVDLLLQNNARVNIRDKQQRLALDLARENNHMSCVDLITNYINQHQVIIPAPPSMQCSIL